VDEKFIGVDSVKKQQSERVAFSPFCAAAFLHPTWIQSVASLLLQEQPKTSIPVDKRTQLFRFFENFVRPSPLEKI
jgi:hypothetical protein